VRTAKWLALGLIMAAIGFSLWNFLLLPTSIAELNFRNALDAKVRAHSTLVDLEKLMPGNWELACESHSYDGELHLSRYNRTYPPVAPPQDGVWGLIFIANDGTYTSAVGSCRHGGALIRLNGCVPRDHATLHLAESHGSCPEFVRGDP
jgi:hypothetical protein